MKYTINEAPRGKPRDIKRNSPKPTLLRSTSFGGFSSPSSPQQAAGYSAKENKNLGFTLIELLVVISIIGVLASVVLSAVNTARAKARDARRLTDIRQLVTVLQLYFDDNNAFPSNAGCTSGWCCLGHGDSGTCWKGQYHGSTALDNALSPRYIPRIPDDPLNNTALYGDAYMYNVNYSTTIGIAPAVLHWGVETASPTSQNCAGGDIGNWGAGNGPGSSYYCILPVR